MKVKPGQQGSCYTNGLTNSALRARIDYTYSVHQTGIYYQHLLTSTNERLLSLSLIICPNCFSDNGLSDERLLHTHISRPHNQKSARPIHHKKRYNKIGMYIKLLSCSQSLCYVALRFNLCPKNYIDWSFSINEGLPACLFEDGIMFLRS